MDIIPYLVLALLVGGSIAWLFYSDKIWDFLKSITE